MAMSICLSVRLFVCPSVACWNACCCCRPWLAASLMPRPHYRCSTFPSPVKTPAREMYVNGGGLLVESINSSHLLLFYYQTLYTSCSDTSTCTADKLSWHDNCQYLQSTQHGNPLAIDQSERLYIIIINPHWTAPTPRRVVTDRRNPSPCTERRPLRRPCEKFTSHWL